MAVIVEIANNRHAHTLFVKLLHNAGHGRSRLVVVYSHAHEFGAGTRQSGHLLDGRRNVSSVGIGHGLHHNWCIRPDPHTSNHGRDGLSALNRSHRNFQFITGNYAKARGTLELDGKRHPATLKIHRKATPLAVNWNQTPGVLSACCPCWLLAVFLWPTNPTNPEWT